MKNLFYIFIIVVAIVSCNSSKKVATTNNAVKSSDTIRIANDSLEYEVIIIDPSFNTYLYSQAKPRNYYSESFLESRNQIYVAEWNRRVLQPFQFDSSLYEMQINYDSNIHYGYEVNYLIYNYFIFFQTQYKQQLSGFLPRR